MPPFVPNTSGLKVPISTSITLWLYFLLFSFSCSLNIVFVYLPWLDRELICVTRTSITLKVILSLCDCHEIFTTNWPGIEVCQYVVSIKIDNTMTTINTNLWNHLKTNFSTPRPAIENPTSGICEWGVWQITSVKIEKKNVCLNLEMVYSEMRDVFISCFRPFYSVFLTVRALSTDYLCIIWRSGIWNGLFWSVIVKLGKQF